MPEDNFVSYFGLRKIEPCNLLPFLTRIICVVAVFAAFSCSLRPGSLKRLDRAGLGHSAHDVTVALPGHENRSAIATYLGCGGVMIQKDGDGILVDPFFSNQRAGMIGRSVFLGKEGRKLIHSDREMVDVGTDAIFRRGGDSLTIHAILSAHSHYDHLLDVPALYQRLDGQPRLLLTESGYNIIHQTIDSSSVTIIDRVASTPQMRERPIVLPTESGAIHVYPIRADHNPHFRHLKFFSGARTTPSDELTLPYDKTRANLWLEGNTYSFLIDYVDDEGNITFRAFIQSSSCPAPAGIPPMELLERPVDIAFLGVVSYHFSPDYPCELIGQLKPRQIVWIHWEDFFRRYTEKPKTVRGTDVPAFFELPCIKPLRESGKILWPRVAIKLVY